MGPVRLSLSLPHYVLLASLVLPPVLPQGASVVFAVACAALALMYVRSRPAAEGWQFAWPLVPLAVPLVYGFFGHPAGDWIRDVALFTKPALVVLTGLLFGHVVARRHGAWNVERLAVTGAAIAAVIYLLFGVHGRTDTSALIDFEPLWNRGGFYVWVPALLLVVLRVLAGWRLTRLQLVSLPLLGTVVLLSQSRAVVLAICVGLTVALFRSRLRAVRPGRLLVVGTLLVSVAVATIMARIDATPGIAAVNELEFTSANYGEENERWRGFEVFMAVRKWEDGSSFERIFGHGFGSQIELGITFFLAGRHYDAIPQSHNGYATLLVKTGIVGIVCFLLYYASLVVISWRTAGIAARERRPAVLAVLAAAFMIPIMAYSIEGVTSPGAFDPTLTFIGAILGANTSRLRRWKPLPVPAPYLPPAGLTWPR
jgi:hypothetical protein